METMNYLKMVRVKIALLTLSALTLVSSASAATMNWTPISEIIQGLVAFLPDLIDLVVGMVPIIIVISIVGFIVAFLDRILGMLHI